VVIKSSYGCCFRGLVPVETPRLGYFGRCHHPNREKHGPPLPCTIYLEGAVFVCFRCVALQFPAIVRSERFRCSSVGRRSPAIGGRTTLARHRSSAGTIAVPHSRFEFLLWDCPGTT